MGWIHLNKLGTNSNNRGTNSNKLGTNIQNVGAIFFRYVLLGRLSKLFVSFSTFFSQNCI